jgi:hypothetical protein
MWIDSWIFFITRKKILFNFYLQSSIAHEIKKNRYIFLDNKLMSIWKISHPCNLQNEFISSGHIFHIRRLNQCAPGKFHTNHCLLSYIKPAPLVICSIFSLNYLMRRFHVESTSFGKNSESIRGINCSESIVILKKIGIDEKDSQTWWLGSTKTMNTTIGLAWRIHRYFGLFYF